jgi:hypothetical protein
MDQALVCSVHPPISLNQLPFANAAFAGSSRPQSSKNCLASPPGLYWYGKSVEKSKRSVPTTATARSRYWGRNMPLAVT